MIDLKKNNQKKKKTNKKKKRLAIQTSLSVVARQIIYDFEKEHVIRY